MAQLFVYPFARAVLTTGVTAPGALLYFYLTGTTTPAAVYADAGLTTPLANPVAADAYGNRANIFLATDTVYRVVEKTSTGASLGRDADPVYGKDPSIDGIAAEAIAAATVQAEIATAAAEAAAAASLSAGDFYVNAAATNVPRGLTQASVGAITAGSGGTNGTFALGFSGGNFSVNPTGTFTVAGGVLTAVTITGPGLYIGASPTVPTVSFAASSGLTGAAVALTAQFLVANGVTYWVESGDATQLLAYTNVGGVATAVAGLGPIPLDIAAKTAAAAASATAAAASAAAAASNPGIVELQNAGGRKNLWPDPFGLDFNVVANGGFRTGLAGSQTPFTFGAGTPTWVYSAATTLSPYPDGKVLTRPSANVTTPEIQIYLDRLGLVAGDVIEFSQEMAYSTAVATASGSIGTYQFLDGAGAAVGASANLYNLTSGSGALDNTPKRFTTGAITIPAGARALKFSYTLWGTGAIEIYSTWMHKGSTLTKPVGTLSPPDEYGRFKALEATDPTANNILLKQFTYASSTLAIGPSGTALNTVSANNGMSSNFVTASIPAGGFNAIQQIFNWATASGGPSRIYVQIRTAAAGSNASLGKLIAEGWIGVDPNALTSGLQSVLLYDVITGLPRTIQAADSDMLARYSVGYFGVMADGNYSTFMYVNYATASDGDPTFPGYYLMGVPVGQGAVSVISSSTSQYCAANRVLLTTPSVVYLPSVTFSGNVAVGLDQVPALDMLPQRIWNVVGMETWVYYAGLQQRPVSRTNFYADYTFVGSYPSNPSGMFEEGVCIKETAAGTKTLTLSASIGSTLYSTKTTSVKTAANTAGAGTTVRVLGLGSSLMQNAGLQSNLLSLVADTSINPGGAATGLNIVNVGTVGTAPNKMEGRSGQSIDIYFTSGDVFYNGGTFDFAYYVTNSLAGVPPTHVVLGDPYWSVASAATDGAAALGAASCVARIEQMITSIAAYNTANGTTIKTLIWFPPVQPEFGQDGEPRTLTSISQHQRNRNLKEAAKLYAATFTTAREASRVYACGFNAVGNPEVTTRYQWAPRGPGARALISTTLGPYADYAAMVAAAASIGDGVIVQAGTDYWVKMGAGANGGFRQATEIDGFVRRIVDSTHGCPYREIAQQVFACIKNNP